MTFAQIDGVSATTGFNLGITHISRSKEHVHSIIRLRQCRPNVFSHKVLWTRICVLFTNEQPLHTEMYPDVDQPLIPRENRTLILPLITSAIRMA